MKTGILALLLVAVFVTCTGCDISNPPSPETAGVTGSPQPSEPTTEPIPEPTPEPTPEPKPIVAILSVCGDVMSHMPQTNAAYNPETGTYDYTECLKYAAQWLTRSDFAVANLETTLGGEPYSGYPLFSTPDGLAYSLKESGIDLLSTANNHSMDTGFAGLCRTLDVLDEAGIFHVGTYRTQEEYDFNSGIVIADVGGISVAFLSYTYGTNGIPVSTENSFSVNIFNTDYLTTICTLDKERLARDMEAARALDTDLIAVMMHWGLEYHTSISPYQEEAADFLIANGADLILGGHPHVCQPMEFREVTLEDGSVREGFVIFSLGNFISGQSPYSLKNGEYTDTTAIVNLELTKDPVKGKTSVTAVTYVPCLMLNRYTVDNRYYLLDAYRSIWDYQEGDTSIVTSAVYDRLEKAIDDCRKILGDIWMTEYDLEDKAA